MSTLLGISTWKPDLQCLGVPGSVDWQGLTYKVTVRLHTFGQTSGLHTLQSNSVCKVKEYKLTKVPD